MAYSQIAIIAFSRVSGPGGGWGGEVLRFGSDGGCAAEAAKPIPIFKCHFGGKGVPIIKGLAEKGNHY